VRRWLVSFCRPTCQFCEQRLTGASRLPVCEDCLAFRTREKACAGSAEFRSMRLSGKEDTHRSGELFEDVCIGCRSEKLHFDRTRSFAHCQGSLVRAAVLLKI
jgi:hypothetical protein